MKKIILPLLLGTLLLAGCSETTKPEKVSKEASTEPTETEKIKTEFNVGEQIKLGDTILTVTNVEASNGVQYNTLKEGMEYTIVHVKIENSGSENVSYNPFYFQIKNSNGQITNQTFTTITQNTSLNSGELASGGVVEGTIPFETPVGDTGLQLIYQPSMWDKQKVITVNLQ